MRSQTEKSWELAQEAVAVIIPVRNRPELLAQCLSSLEQQDFPMEECEVLICDDCSQQDLGPAVEKFRSCLPKIKLLRANQAKGPASARNLGFRSSNASIFVCLDSDVICDQNLLRHLVDALISNPDWVAAEATVRPIGACVSPLWDAPVNSGSVYLSAASAYRAEAIRWAGGFDETFPLAACEDTDLAARILRLGKYGYVPAAVAYHPRRRVTLRTHWQWRRHWKYVTILALRYGFLGFPGRSATRFPRLRVALSAIVSLPARRFIEGIKYARKKPLEGILASLYSIFDVYCGHWALPDILLTSIQPRRDYLSDPKEGSNL
jgi:GT2 family glycosyltransferase